MSDFVRWLQDGSPPVPSHDGDNNNNKKVKTCGKNMKEKYMIHVLVYNLDNLNNVDNEI